jgi:hypothetical protein
MQAAHSRSLLRSEMPVAVYRMECGFYDIDVSLPAPADLATFGFGPDTLLNPSYSVPKRF